MANNPYVNKVVYGGQTLIDISDTTATADKILQGYTAYGADGQKLTGTATGSGGYVTQDQDGYIVLPSTGGGITVEALNVTQNGTYTAQTGHAYSPVTVNVSGSPSATQHTIYFEFTDETDTTINAWYDSSFISDAITSTTPTTYGQKTVSLAQLDGVTWYEPAPIPVGVELIDFTKTTNDYAVNSSGNLVAEQWYSVSDYTEIDPSMTFSYSGCYWFYIGFYDASKNTISALSMSSDGTQRPNDTNYCDGTLTPAKIPSNAKYVRITSTYNPDSTILSLIRTA